MPLAHIADHIMWNTSGKLQIPSFLSDNKDIKIHADYEWLVSSNVPMAAFATHDIVDRSVNHTLEDMYPVIPTIDLKKQHIYEEQTVTGR